MYSVSKKRPTFDLL